MRKIALFTCLTLITLPAMAEILSCETLRSRVDEKLQEKKVPSYTLEIVPSTAVSINTESASSATKVKEKKGTEVGTCDGGTKRLLYIRGN